jgi:hypothetical protein
MARQSAASLAVVRNLPGKRVAPPDGLTDAETELWQAVVDSKPAEWFGADSAPLVVEYVRAVGMCGVLDERLQSMLGDKHAAANDIKLILDMRDKESRRACTLATKLRLTQQSRYTPSSAGTANKRAAGKRPWQS